MSLERCVGDKDKFLASQWGKEPLLRSGVSANGFADLITLAEVDSLLAGAALRYPAVRLVKAGTPLPLATFTKKATIGSRPLHDLIDPGRVHSHFADGATIVLQGLHRYWPRLADFCRGLELELSHPVQVNLYLTPPGSQGLNVHYDTHDVFVLQVSGKKEWRVYGAAVEAPLPHQKKRSPEDPGEPLEQAVLRPGDALYIPRGFLHAAATNDAESAHLTVGVLAHTWRDVLTEIMKDADDLPYLRRALPPGYVDDRAQWGDEMADVVERIAAWLTTVDPEEIRARMARRFYSGRAPLLEGQLRQILALDDIDDSTEVTRRRGAVFVVSSEEWRAVVRLGDRRLEMPPWLSDVLDHIAGLDRFVVGDLSAWLDEPSRKVLVRRLVREGALEQVLRD